MKKFILGVVLGVIATIGAIAGYGAYTSYEDKKIASKIETMDKQARRNYDEKKYAEAEKGYLELLNQSQAQKESYNVFYYAYALATIYEQNLGDPVKAHQYYKIAEKQIADDNYSQEAFGFYNNYANFLYNKGEKEGSVDVLKKYVAIAEHTKDDDSLFSAYEFLGSGYAAIKDQKNSDIYFAKAMEILDNKMRSANQDYWYSKALILNNRAASMIETGLYKEALPLANESVDILTSELTHDDQGTVSDVYDTLGEIEYKLQNYDNALDYLKKSMATRIDFSDSRVAETARKYGDVMLKLERIPEACQYWKKAVNAYINTGNDSELRYLKRVTAQNSCK
jgi:tetratricopeptide (TPR) repeat protein